jgi:hypothetical protein
MVIDSDMLRQQKLLFDLGIICVSTLCIDETDLFHENGDLVRVVPELALFLSGVRNRPVERDLVRHELKTGS